SGCCVSSNGKRTSGRQVDLMQASVWFALITLAVVFCISFLVLVALCWRRRQQENARHRADDNFRFIRSRDGKIEDLVELSPLLNEELSKLDWADGAEGPFADVIAILRLTTQVVKIVSAVSLTRAANKIYDVVVQSMFRVDTHFHELLEFTPTKPEDLRVIEARALTLTTTVWALNAAFTLHGFDQVKDVEGMVIKMYEHVDSLRQLIPGYVGVGEADENEENADSQATEDTTADGVQISHASLNPTIEVTAEIEQPPKEEDGAADAANAVADLAATNLDAAVVEEDAAAAAVNTDASAAADPPPSSPPSSKSSDTLTPKTNGSPLSQTEDAVPKSDTVAPES
ncbi:hypothetical protein PFISCL1PPCAC_20233, partial [Pristionchus fissidentatus]